MMISSNHHFTETHFIFSIFLSSPCLALGLFMLYLRDLFFISSLISIVINDITSFKQTYLFFLHFLEYLLLFLNSNMDKESE